MDIKALENLSQKPKLFEKSHDKFWDDKHISKKMLEAHLNPEFDAASRKHSTINTSVKWLSNEILVNKNSKILDLGCGPGLYASRLSKKGYSVTGIDYSKRSIDYAKKEAKEKSLPIKYVYQNYLTIDYKNEFDAVLLIYCDLGALSNKERDTLLNKIYKSLKPGGLFIFDVFSDKKKRNQKSLQNWTIKSNGFWNEKPYLELSKSFEYVGDDVFLDQKIIIDSKNEIHLYRLYEHFYTRKTITNVLDQTGFKDHRYYSDITGRKFTNESNTIAVVTEK